MDLWPGAESHRAILIYCVQGTGAGMERGTLVLNVLSMLAMIAGILMHSGRGGGLSHMFGGGGGTTLIVAGQTMPL